MPLQDHKGVEEGYCPDGQISMQKRK
jgi:hypothetical protein